MMFIDLKTEDGVIKGKLSFCCRMLNVTRQGFYKYLADKDRPWKYEDLADAMRAIVAEDVCNGTYGRIRMYQALLLKQPEGIRIPGGGGQFTASWRKSDSATAQSADQTGLQKLTVRRANLITC